MRMPIRGGDWTPMLAGIAYFNSLLYKTSIRFYSQQVVTLGRKKGRTPCESDQEKLHFLEQRSGAVVRVERWYARR